MMAVSVQCRELTFECIDRSVTVFFAGRQQAAWEARMRGRIGEILRFEAYTDVWRWGEIARRVEQHAR